jgi:hypothetical protein
MGLFAAMAGAALIGGATQLIAGGQAAKEAARARAAAGDLEAQKQLRIAEAIERLEAEGVPAIEAQKVILESPQLVGLQDIPEIGETAMAGIQEQMDPRLKGIEREALEGMQAFTGAGMTESERAQDILDQQQVAGEVSAQRKAVLQKMAEQGTGTQGAAVAAMLEGTSKGAESRRMQKAAQAAERDKRRMAAHQAAGRMAGGMSAREFDQLSQVASAKDRIKQFDTNMRAQIEGANLARRQQIENQRAAAAQQQELHNKGLLQQDYQNRIGKAQAIANAKMGQATQLGKDADRRITEGQAAAEGRLKQGAAIGGMITDLGTAYAKYGPDAKKPTKEEQNAADGGIIGYEDGGAVYDKYAGGGIDVDPMEEEIVPGDDFAGDRIDAKINSGEMVLNVDQQQRLMELLKGYRDLKGLGDEDIVEPASEAPMPELPMPPAPESSQLTGDSGIIMDEDLESYAGVGGDDLRKMAVRKAGEQEFADGGVAGSDPLVKGLTKEYSTMSKQADQMKEAQKQTNARIKAIETLMGLEKKKV